MERVLQILDDVDDLFAYAGHAWLAVAWRVSGLAGILAAALAFTLPL